MKSAYHKPAAELIRFHFDEHIAGAGSGLVRAPQSVVYEEAMQYPRPKSIRKYCTWFGTRQTGCTNYDVPSDYL